MPADIPAAFFSYSHEDLDFALRLAEDLKAGGANVWMDQLIEPGTRWNRVVEDALENCPRMLVILSPASVKSNNVLDEVARAIRTEKTVIPVLYLDCKIPLQLERHQRIDFRTDYDHGLRDLLKTLVVEQQPAANTAGAAAAPKESPTTVPAEGPQPPKPAGRKPDRKRDAGAAGRKAVPEKRGPIRALDYRALTVRKIHAINTHASTVSELAITPDGLRAVSTFGDNALKVWDLVSESELLTLAGHSGPVSAVAVTPDGRRAVSASWDKTLKVWELSTGRELHALTGHSEGVNAAAVTADGKRVVSASLDRTLKIWDLASGRELRTLTGHLSSVNAVAVTMDGRHAVSASSDKTLKVWDFDSGREVRTFTGHKGAVTRVAVTPDGRFVVSASVGSQTKVWEFGSGRELRTVKGPVMALAVSPDGQCAISVYYWDTTLKLWELCSGCELATFKLDAMPYCCAVSADGKTILAGDDKGFIHYIRLA